MVESTLLYAWSLPLSMAESVVIAEADDPQIWQAAFQAFTEGWALYSENLAAEMGVHEDDPLGRPCQLRLMMTRISRLVIDKGLNALGWTWDGVAAFMLEETGQRLSATRSLFFDAHPAQECSYDIGYLTLLELRQRSMDALGDAFDIRTSHDAILLHGTMPLSTLEWVIDEWVKETLTGV